MNFEREVSVVNFPEVAEQVITNFFNFLKKHPLILIIIVPILAVLVFFACIQAGESIGDAIWG